MTKSRKDKKGRVLRKGESFDAGKNLYRYCYKDYFGKRVSIYSPDLLELREREQDIKKNAIGDTDMYLDSKVTLNFVYERYIATKVNLRETTRINYEYMYDRFVRNNIGNIPISKLKYSDIYSFYLYLINKKGMQVTTLDTIHTILHPAFKMAVRDEIIRSNPTDGIMAELKRSAGKNKGVRHALTYEQQLEFMRYINGHPLYDHWFTLFTVLLGTGCRIGELVGLRWQDIDFENRIISINHAVVYYAKKGSKTKKSELQVSLPKTEAGVRYIPMLDQVYDALVREYNEQKEVKGFCTYVLEDMTGFVFYNRNGTPQNPQNINRAIKGIVASHNQEEILKAKRQRREPVMIPDFSCHVLRHTFCTRLCEVESNLKAIQDIMGHKNIETTMDVYAEATKNSKNRAIETMSNKFDLY